VDVSLRACAKCISGQQEDAKRRTGETIRSLEDIDDQMIKAWSQANFDTYLTQPPAFRGPQPHPAAHDHTAKDQPPDSVLAGQGSFRLVVAGVGFEPT
jgi:hypothetical protein